MASSMKAAIFLWPDILKNSNIYKNTRFENIENVFNTTQKIDKRTSRKNLNVRNLEDSSPSWTRSDDQAVKLAKEKVCFYAFSVLCVGRMESVLEAAE